MGIAPKNERFKELRKTLGMNQREFGKLFGVSNATVCQIETGKRNVSERNILLIIQNSTIPAVNPDWLRYGTEPMFKTVRDYELDHFAKMRGASDLEIRIFKAYLELPKDQRDYIIDHFATHLHTKEENEE